MSDEPKDAADEPGEAAEDGEDEDFAPLVVVTQIGELAAWMPPGVAKKFANLSAWFLLEEDAELVGLFDRVPEDPMSKGQIDAILGGLRAFAEAKSEELQLFIGPTDSIGVGFHVDAPLARVRASFEEDGFEITATIKEGQLVEE